jgi:tyrosyl-tRNA synthetase
MSQSLGNYVAVSEPPDEMFGKLMRVPDGLIPKFLRLCTDVPPGEVGVVERGLADGSLHPNDQKRRMAREIVDLYHGAGVGEAAEARFDHVHREREIPDDIPELRLADLGIAPTEPIWIVRLLVACSLAPSSAEARRLLSQGGVRLDGRQLAPDEELSADDLDSKVLQVGRRRFVRLLA